MTSSEQRTVGDLDPDTTVYTVGGRTHGRIAHLYESCEGDNVTLGNPTEKEARVLPNDTPVCSHCDPEYDVQAGRNQGPNAASIKKLEDADPTDPPGDISPVDTIDDDGEVVL